MSFCARVLLSSASPRGRVGACSSVVRWSVLFDRLSVTDALRVLHVVDVLLGECRRRLFADDELVAGIVGGLTLLYVKYKTNGLHAHQRR